MQLTKFTHSCVRLDDDDRALVLDPGAFSEVDEALDGAQAVLVTHEHFDHVAVDAVRAALARDPRMQLWAPEPVAAQFAEFGSQVSSVAAGQSFDAAGLRVRTFGGQHALIHPSIPIVANVGYLVDDAVYHPGDSLIVPPAPVEVLLLPVNAPWSKVSEVIDYAIGVRAPKAVGIHDALLTDPGRQLVATHLGNLAGPLGVEYAYLAPRDTIDV